MGSFAGKEPADDRKELAAAPVPFGEAIEALLVKEVVIFGLTEQILDARETFFAAGQMGADFLAKIAADDILEHGLRFEIAPSLALGVNARDQRWYRGDWRGRAGERPQGQDRQSFGVVQSKMNAFCSWFLVLLSAEALA